MSFQDINFQVCNMSLSFLFLQVLRSLYRNSSSSFDKTPHKSSTHRDGCSHEANVSLNGFDEQLNSQPFTIPSTNWLLWLPQTIVGPYDGTCSLLMRMISLKKRLVEYHANKLKALQSRLIEVRLVNLINIILLSVFLITILGRLSK